MATRSFVPTTRDLPSGPIRRIVDGLLNLLYPDHCVVCSTPVSRLRECGVCETCWKRVLLLKLAAHWCPSCGIPFQSFEPGAGHLCGKCTVEMPSYSGARSYGYYRLELSRLVQEFKFRGRRNLADLLGSLLAQAFLESWDRSEIDLIVPLPLHPLRKRLRGFNQAALLAQELSRLLALPCAETALDRIRPTPPQVGLTDAERVHNVRNAFSCRKPVLVRGKRVLLVDDVMTTGATAASASLGLLEAGARRVSVLTVARAVPGIE